MFVLFLCIPYERGKNLEPFDNKKRKTTPTLAWGYGKLGKLIGHHSP